MKTKSTTIRLSENDEKLLSFLKEENSTKIKCSNSSMERRSAVFDGVTDIQI